MLRLIAVFARLAKQLGRIADALDRAYPPGAPAPSPRKPSADDLTSYDPEADWEAEQEEERRAALGRSKFDLPLERDASDV